MPVADASAPSPSGPSDAPGGQPLNAPPSARAAAGPDVDGRHGPDAYEITDWEPRGPFDRLVQAVAGLVRRYRPWLAVLVLLGLTIGWLRPHQDFLLTRLGVLITLAAVVPILVVVVIIWSSDRTSREPLGLIFATFLAGAGVAVLAAMINAQFSYLAYTVALVLVVAPGEELMKLAATYAAVYRHKAFDHAIDGVYYGVAAGAGFAAIENTWQVARHAALHGEAAAWEVVLVRTFLSTPAHALWTGIAGYYLGVAKFNPRHRTVLITKGVLIASLGHAAHNLLVSLGTYAGIALAAAVNLGLLVFLIWKVRRWFAYYGLVGRAGATAGTGTDPPPPA